MILDRLIGIGHGERRKRVVERLAPSHVAGDDSRVAGAGVRARERPAAQPGIFRQRLLLGELADRAEPAVLQDANIEFDPLRLVRRPAEKNVARRLHHPLPLDHAPALRALVGKLLRESLEDGALRLLDLQEERLAVAAEEQPDNTDRADGSDAHRFESDVRQSIAVEQHRPVGSERFAVRARTREQSRSCGLRASSD